MDTAQVVTVSVASKALHLYSRMTLPLHCLGFDTPALGRASNTGVYLWNHIHRNSLCLNRLVETPRDFPTRL